MHVEDLAVAERQDLEALPASTVIAQPARGADDLVVADLREVGLDPDSPPAALPDLELQDLTGLVGAVSDRGLLHP